MAPVRKRSRNSDRSSEAIDITTFDSGCCNCKEALEDLSHELVEVQTRITKIFELTKSSKVPLGLRELLNQSFTCKICRGIVDPLVIVTKCCKAILGCDECVKLWYATDPLSKNCPSCNTERGYVEMMRLHGLDDFLTAIKKIEEEG